MQKSIYFHTRLPTCLKQHVAKIWGVDVLAVGWWCWLDGICTSCRETAEEGEREVISGSGWTEVLHTDKHTFACCWCPAKYYGSLFSHVSNINKYKWSHNQTHTSSVRWKFPFFLNTPYEDGSHMIWKLFHWLNQPSQSSLLWFTWFTASFSYLVYSACCPAQW